MSGEVDLPEGMKHGNRSAYLKYKCRCEDCRAAQTDYTAQWRKRRRIQTQDGTLPADYSAIRVRELLQRMSVEDLIRRVGLSRSTIHGLASLEAGSDARVSPRVETALRTLTSIYSLSETDSRVDADPTIRRVQHLRLLGYSGHEIAKTSGLRPKTIYSILRTQQTVKKSTADAIRDAHERLSKNVSLSVFAPRISAEASALGYTPYEEKKNK